MITLKTLPQATAQEVFDQVAEHLLTQGERCQNSAGECEYYGDKGARCAAGCLIGADEYKDSFENNNWEALVCNYSVPRDHCKLIEALQRVHDSDSPKFWRQALESVADKFNFKFNH